MACTAWPKRNLLRRKTQQTIATTGAGEAAQRTTLGLRGRKCRRRPPDRDSVVPRRNRANCSRALLRPSQLTRVTIPITELDATPWPPFRRDRDGETTMSAER